ncbi:hypothetical protein KCU65_g7896, partial [Aureobasidium melanogenum]
MTLKTILSDRAFAPPTGILNHARVFNGIVMTSGQIGADTKGVVVSDSVAEQAEQMLKNLEAVLSDAGSGLDRIMNANIFLSDPAYYVEFNAVYNKMIPDPKPPRTCVFVGLPSGIKCEMNLQAAVNDSGCKDVNPGEDPTRS